MTETTTTKELPLLRPVHRPRHTFTAENGQVVRAYVKEKLHLIVKNEELQCLIAGIGDACAANATILANTDLLRIETIAAVWIPARTYIAGLISAKYEEEVDQANLSGIVLRLSDTSPIELVVQERRIVDGDVLEHRVWDFILISENETRLIEFIRQTETLHQKSEIHHLS
jgi:hypothetical protein